MRKSEEGELVEVSTKWAGSDGRRPTGSRLRRSNRSREVPGSLGNGGSESKRVFFVVCCWVVVPLSPIFASRVVGCLTVSCRRNSLAFVGFDGEMKGKESGRWGLRGEHRGEAWRCWTGTGGGWNDLVLGGEGRPGDRPGSGKRQRVLLLWDRSAWEFSFPSRVPFSLSRSLGQPSLASLVAPSVARSQGSFGTHVRMDLRPRQTQVPDPSIAPAGVGRRRARTAEHRMARLKAATLARTMNVLFSTSPPPWC